MADTQLTPFDMGTFGSRTTPDMSPRLRRTAAAAREMLIDLAAEAWKADRSHLRAENGSIIHSGTAQQVEFGKLTKGQKLTKSVADDTASTPAKSWTIAGHSVPKVDGRSFVTGGHQYASDIRLPGMLFGKILRPPSFGATLASIDPSGAKSMPGVVVVQDGDFVGVAAPSSSLADARADSDQGRMETRTSALEQGPLRELEVTGPPGARRARRRMAWRQARSPVDENLREFISSRLIRLRTSRTRRSSPVRRWPAGRTASSPSGPDLSAPSACVTS